MAYTQKEVLSFVKENRVKFIFLAFCDIFGTQKQIAIMPDELASAFQNGVSFDASSILGFCPIERSDLFLFPDADTLSLLPWKSQFERVVRLFCDIKTPDGHFYENDSRYLLKTAVSAAQKAGLFCQIGPECEFYLFKTDQMQNPTTTPQDEGGYCDIAPLDKCENIRREICLCLEEMDISPETSHHEQGPGQNEIDFRYQSPLVAADNMITFKSAVKAIATRNGLFASFMPKPLMQKSGSGFHVNLSLIQDGKNIFSDLSHDNSIASHFLAGVLDNINDMTAILNPLVNSYARLGSHEAPSVISWSYQNRSQLVRIPAVNQENSARMELRCPDPAANPYLTLSLIIYAGIEGILKNIPLPDPVFINTNEKSKETLNLSMLPQTLNTALDIFENSRFIRKYLPSSMITQYLNLKRAEWAEAKSHTDLQMYFMHQ